VSRPSLQLRDAALAYASRGIPVLPLHYPSPTTATSSPLTNALARCRSSTRPNRPAIRPSSASNAARQPAGGYAVACGHRLIFGCAQLSAPSPAG
jgi:hypothetical protein